MPATASKDQSALVNKLILLVLVCILGCLVTLLVRQNNFLAEQEQQVNLRPTADELAVAEDAAGLSLPPPARQRTTASPILARARPPAAPLVSTPLAEEALAQENFAPPKAELLAPASEIVVASSQAVFNGSEINGTVWLRGTLPPEIPIQMDAICGRLQTNAPTTHHYVVSSDGRLANVFVYVKSDLLHARYDPPQETPLLDQRGCFFEPYVLGVMTRQKLKIRNSDPLPTLHNVNTGTSRFKGNQFSLAQPYEGQTAEKFFEHSEVFVKVVCNVHPWMLAYIGVVDHPYFAVTDTNGNFEFPMRLPAGTYTLAAKHPKAGELTQRITVGRTNQEAITFVFQLK